QVATAQRRVVRAAQPLGGSSKASRIEVDEPAFDTNFLPHAKIARGTCALDTEFRLRVGLIPATDTKEKDAETRADPRLVVWGPGRRHDLERATTEAVGNAGHGCHPGEQPCEHGGTREVG